MEPTFGAILAPHDYRDDYAASMAESLAIPLPSTFHTDLGEVLHQKKIPACVSHSVVAILRLYWYKKLGKWIDFSPRFLDILSDESWIPLDGGRVPRTVMKIATNIGCCTTDLLPNNTDLPIGQYRDSSVITPEMIEEANKYRIPGYINVKKLYDTRTAIYLHGAVSTLFSIGNELWTPSWAFKDISPLRTPKEIVSGHQMTPNGWSNEHLNSVRNSWGKDWGKDGEVSYSEKDWSPFIAEQWAVADLPDDMKTFLKTLPSPSEFHYQWDTNLKYGDYNDDVKYAQIAFMILGFLEPIPPDELGYFGNKTAAANEKFQRANKIAPTSAHNIGPQTRKTLNKLFIL